MRRIGLLLLVLALTTCSLFEQKASLLISLPPASRSGGHSAKLISALTAKFRITVSGGGLATAIVTEITGSSSSTTAKIDLPGTGTYNVTVDGVDLGDVTLTSGSATVDAVPGVNYVTIVMLPVNPFKLYVTNRTDGTVTVINGVDGSFITTIAVAAAPTAIGVSQTTRKVYVAHFDQNVTVINGSTDAVSTTIGSAAGGDYPSIAVDPVANKIYAAWQYDSTVQLVNVATDTMAPSSLAVTYPTSMAVNTATSKVYVLDWGDSDIEVLYGPTDTLLNTIYPVSSFEKSGIVANPVTNKIYVADGLNPGSVLVIDGATDSLPVATIAVGANLSYSDSDYGNGVAVNTITNKIYVTNSLDNTVSVIDGQTDSVVATINVGSGPFGVAVSRNYNKVYVANRFAGTVSVIDGATNAVTNTLSVGAGPQFIGVLED